MISKIAPAKINLALHITNKRADGYHLMESMVAFADVGDEISVSLADTLRLEVQGRFAHLCGDVEHNLVLRAARLLQSHLKETRGAIITLTKHLPVGAGLGGGSSDAAMAAKLLLQLWQRIMPESELIEIISPLGADMAMCVIARPLIARGIGDEITLLDVFPTIPILMVWPDAMLSTIEAYRAYKHMDRPVPALPSATTELEPYLAALESTRNDLQQPAIACCAAVMEALLALETLPQQPLVRMSGSGACCIAYFTNADSAKKALETMRTHYPNWWSKCAYIKGV